MPRIADQVGILRNGRLLRQDATQDLMDTYLKLSSQVRAAGDAARVAAAMAARAAGVEPLPRVILLARRMHVEVLTVVRMAQRMEAAGLAAPAPRSQQWPTRPDHAHPPRRRAARAIPPLLGDVSEQALTGLDITEREMLIGLLKRITSTGLRPETLTATHRIRNVKFRCSACRHRCASCDQGKPASVPPGRPRAGSGPSTTGGRGLPGAPDRDGAPLRPWRPRLCGQGR